MFLPKAIETLINDPMALLLWTPGQMLSGKRKGAEVAWGPAEQSP